MTTPTDEGQALPATDVAGGGTIEEAALAEEVGISKTATDEEPPYPPLPKSWWVVAVLMVIYIFSFVDRQILSLLVGPIRSDLGISDTQMSLLMGFSFAVFYTLFGIPLGRLADSKSRRGIIAAGLVLWSVMTAACGVAQKFWHFLLLRMGVGVGEAALSPSAYSLITDSFPKKYLATAISVYSMGIYIGSGMAYILGGLVVGWASGQGDFVLPIVGATRPWQLVFFMVGLPGILLSLLLLTFKEPVRRGVVKAQDGAVKPIPMAQVVAYIKDNRMTFFCHNLGFALLSFSSYGSGAWIPTFLQRNYGATQRDAGLYYGTIVVIAGTLGIVFGGRIADWLTEKGYDDAKMRAGLIASVVWIPSGLLYPLMPSFNWSIAMMVPTVFFASMPFGCAPAAIQELMPNAMRGQASALYLFVVNLIGLGIGPTAVAMTTDFVFNDDGAVGYSLIAVATLAHIGSALLLWAGLGPFRRSLTYRDRWLDAQA